MQTRVCLAIVIGPDFISRTSELLSYSYRNEKILKQESEDENIVGRISHYPHVLDIMSFSEI